MTRSIPISVLAGNLHGAPLGKRKLTQPQSVRISFQNGNDEELLVTPLGGNLYRVEETSVLGEGKYHESIEAETQPDGILQFRRVVTPSGLKTEYWVLPDAQFESQSLSAYLDKVMAIGGNWESIFGGVLTLHLPLSEASSMLNEFRVLFGNLPGVAR